MKIETLTWRLAGTVDARTLTLIGDPPDPSDTDDKPRRTTTIHVSDAELRELRVLIRAYFAVEDAGI